MSNNRVSDTAEVHDSSGNVFRDLEADFTSGLVTIEMHAGGGFSARYRDMLRDRSGLIGNVDLDTLLDWLRRRLS